MNADNFVVRPHREWVDRYAAWEPWASITPHEADAVADHLAGLPSAVRDSDEQAKRFDLVMLKFQLGQLEGNALAVEQSRATVQGIASALLGQLTIPSVKQQERMLDDLAGDDWWVDVTLPMLELARRRVRGLVRLIEKGRRNVVYTDFEDTLGEGTEIELPGTSVGTDVERFTAKARAYLKAHEDHVAVQRLMRNKQLTEQDLSALEGVLIESGAGTPEDLSAAAEESHGLGLFIRSLVGLDRAAAKEAFAAFLDERTFTSAQIRFVSMIIDHLTANGVVDVAQLYDPPFSDVAPHGPDVLFPEQMSGIVTILDDVRDHATVA